MGRPTYLSLFSGIGGLDLGLDRAGWQCVGQVEIDPFCRKVLEKHWPEVPRHDDVRTCPEWWASTARPAVDAVAGGFPCQGHSVAGRRRGTGDERWGWPWFRDVVDATEPKVVIVENVPNLVRTGLLDVLEDLADRGFDAWWGRVPAAAVGAPHLRWRLFLLAAHPGRSVVRHEPGWSRGAGWAGTAVAGHDGATWLVADPDGPAGRREARDADPGAGGETVRGGPPEPGRRGTALADPDSDGWTERPGVPPATRRHDGADAVGRRPDVADPEGIGGQLRPTETERSRGPASGGADVADPDGSGWRPGSGLGRPGPSPERGGRGCAQSGVGRSADGLSPWLDGRWEHGLARTATGVPNRVDRLRALGNAVVPQVAEHVGRMALNLLEVAADA